MIFKQHYVFKYFQRLSSVIVSIIFCQKWSKYSNAKYFNISDACSISLGDEVAVTGGFGALTTVSRYNRDGWVEDMPSLVTGRKGHGCSRYISGGEQVRHYDAAHNYPIPLSTGSPCHGWPG